MRESPEQEGSTKTSRWVRETKLAVILIATDPLQGLGLCLLPSASSTGAMRISDRFQAIRAWDFLPAVHQPGFGRYDWVLLPRICHRPSWVATATGFITALRTTGTVIGSGAEPRPTGLCGSRGE